MKHISFINLPYILKMFNASLFIDDKKKSNRTLYCKRVAWAPLKIALMYSWVCRRCMHTAEFRIMSYNRKRHIEKRSVTLYVT